MRRVMMLTLDRSFPLTDTSVRTVRNEDAESLALLMLAAYRGTVDYHGETIDDARNEITALFGGHYGALLHECSFVIERDGSLAAASLITLHEGEPLVAFSMTEPRRKRSGLARTCLLHSINALVAAEHTILRLFVTRGNTPAERLYESIGFRDEQRD